MNFLRKIMTGRYGSDQLTLFLVAVDLILYFVASLSGFGIFSVLGSVLVLFAIYRMFSRKTDKRRAENQAFLHFFSPIIHWFHTWKCKRSDKDHCYFKCPNCGQELRVPKGKGKITVTCRSCGVSFEAKS
ncbi:MAG: hypothetical protein RSB55_10090 [Oscillospiraceae bacterium]